MFTISADDPEVQNLIALRVHGTRRDLGNGFFLPLDRNPIPNSSLYGGGKKEEKTKEDEMMFAIEKFNLDKHYAKFNFGKNGEVPSNLTFPKPVSKDLALRLILRHAREFNLTITFDGFKTEFSFSALTDEQKRLRVC